MTRAAPKPLALPLTPAELRIIERLAQLDARRDHAARFTPEPSKA